MRFANIFQDGLVLQRYHQLSFWGTASPNAVLELDLAGKKIRGCANVEGYFTIYFPELTSGGPYILSLTSIGNGEKITLHDVYVGEVYHASGQSNMEWTIAMVEHRLDETLPEDNLPLVREFRVKKATGIGKRNDVDGEWMQATKNSIDQFSAVAFYFARKMHQTLGCAVGVVNTSWGGAIAETYCSRNALQQSEIFQRVVANNDKLLQDCDFGKNTITANFLNDYANQTNPVNTEDCPKDEQNFGVVDGFANLEFDDSEWANIMLPGSWRQKGFDYNGVLWFRKTIKIPEAYSGKDLKVIIGGIDKTDITYFNGVEIGSTGGALDASVWNVKRVYTIPSKLVKAGRNVLAIRACSFMFDGSVTGQIDTFQIESFNGEFRLGLQGEWRCLTEQNYGQVTVSNSDQIFNFPAMLFNNMVSPLIPFAFRGVIFYQGESNCDRSEEYYELMKLLIADWRYHWGQENTSFVMVQLANYMEQSDYDANSDWAVVRDAQRQLTGLKNVGIAITIDVGESDNIHPRNKKTVGERLANWELNKAFGFPITASGPLFLKKQIENDKIRVFFAYADSGLVSCNGTLKCFYLADETRVFVAAEASIESNTVLLHANSITEPCYVRYAWSNNPTNANLYNTDGLPASPFEA